MSDFAVISTLAAMPPADRAVLGGLLGVVVGSYLATILVRWPIRQSANHGRSRCDGCGRRLAWRELVPLASYVALRGRCATCATPIARTHPLVELGCGLLGGYMFALNIPALAPLGWLLLLLAVFDARWLWLPDRLVVPLALLCLIVPGWGYNDLAPSSLSSRLLGGAIGFGGLWLVGRGFRLVTGRTGLGGGDPKLFGAIGLWLGCRELPLLMLVACAIGLIDAAVRWPEGAARRDVHLPLGAYLCVAAIGFALVQPLTPYTQGVFSNDRSDATAAANANEGG